MSLGEKSGKGAVAKKRSQELKGLQNPQQFHVGMKAWQIETKGVPGVCCNLFSPL